MKCGRPLVELWMAFMHFSALFGRNMPEEYRLSEAF